MSKDTTLEEGKVYFLNYTDGSRIKVHVQVDTRGDIDAYNSMIDFFMWTGRKDAPENRDGIESIEEAGE